jgi:hypothetical protein
VWCANQFVPSTADALPPDYLEEQEKAFCLIGLLYQAMHSGLFTSTLRQIAAFLFLQNDRQLKQRGSVYA